MFLVIGTELLFDAANDNLCSGGIHAGQEDGKFISAVAGDDVFRAEHSGKEPGDIDDHLIACFIAVCFVYFFKILHFCCDNADGEQAAFFQAGELGLNEEAVIEPGEGIVCAEERRVPR